MRTFRHILSAVIIASLTTPAFAYAQDLLASNADDEIDAAMHALEEVNAIIHQPSTDTPVPVADSVPVVSTSNKFKRTARTSSNHTDSTQKPEPSIPTKISNPHTDIIAQNLPSPEPEPQKLTTQVKSSKPVSFKVDDLLDEEFNTTKPVASSPNPIQPTHTATSPSYDNSIQTATVPSPVKESTGGEARKHNVQSPTAKTKAQAQAIHKRITSQGIHTTTEKQNNTAAPDPRHDQSNPSLDYVIAIYRANGVDLRKSFGKETPSIARLYQDAFSKKLVYQSTSPSVGDLAFFHNTFDRDLNGQWDDWHTLVGIVESVDEIDDNHTITILTYRNGRIDRFHLNLKYPELAKSRKGNVLNSQLRSNQGDNKGTAAKLFAGFVNFLGDAKSITVIDNWTPGMK